MKNKLQIQEAENEAKSVIAKLEITSLPICPFSIARQCDIVVEPKDSNRNCLNWIKNSPLLLKTLFILNSSARSLKKSMISRSGSGMVAIRVSTPLILAKALIRRVLPVPTSPVRSKKPLSSRIAYLKAARPSLCFSLTQKNLESGLMLNGCSLRLK